MIERAHISYQYIIDVDSTVKPIYWHQEGAELGYKPIKPGPALRTLVPIR